MTESTPIGDQVLREFQHLAAQVGAELKDDAQTVATRLTRILHPHQYHDTQQPSVDGTRAPEGNMSFADDIKQDLTDGLDYAEGLVTRLKGYAPTVLAKLQKYADSPVVTALETAGAAIDAPAEQIIAGWIRDLANLKLGTTVAAPAPAAPETPAADTPAPAAPAAA